MKEPKGIPLDPSTPRTHKPKSYRLESLNALHIDLDYYQSDSDSIHTPIRYQIHEDFAVESTDPSIIKHYENYIQNDKESI